MLCPFSSIYVRTIYHFTAYLRGNERFVATGRYPTDHDRILFAECRGGTYVLSLLFCPRYKHANFELDFTNVCVADEVRLSPVSAACPITGISRIDGPSRPRTVLLSGTTCLSRTVGVIDQARLSRVLQRTSWNNLGFFCCSSSQAGVSESSVVMQRCNRGALVALLISSLVSPASGSYLQSRVACLW